MLAARLGVGRRGGGSAAAAARGQKAFLLSSTSTRHLSTTTTAATNPSAKDKTTFPSPDATSTTAAPSAAIVEALTRNKKVYTSTFKKAPKPKVVILGSGWAGFMLARQLKKKLYDVTLVSERNHFLFTPLLPSTTVGTLEFRCIQEPVRTIPGLTYYQAQAIGLDIQEKRVVCKELLQENQEEFNLSYDYLFVAVGSRTNTFGVPGVCRENDVFFLKQLADARAIRSKIIECFERASYPGVCEAEQARLLSFVVVGGGPTSVEFASELHDFLRKDVHAWYPDLEDQVTVTLIEASNHILGTFDERLVSYVSSLFAKRKITVLTETSVKKVEKNVVWLQDGSPMHFGLCVWSTGVKATELIESLPSTTVQKGRGGRLLIDNHLRLLTPPPSPPPDPSPDTPTQAHIPKHTGIYALGDCAISDTTPLPPLAQAAQQQAKYLAMVFNTYPDPQQHEENDTSKEENTTKAPTHTYTQKIVPPFQYNHMGSMAQLGMWKGVVDASKLEDMGKKPAPGRVLSGLTAFLLWRSAYWTKSVSLANKCLIPMYWLKSWIFGRDISRF